MFTRIKNRFIEAVSPEMNLFLLELEKGPSTIPYSRPPFLQLLTPDELKASADHSVRPIIVPRDISLLPWGTGYAECVNAGKSVWNEDQAAFYRQALSDPTKKRSDLPYTYFGIFDGHAGTGAAMAAAKHFHHILHERLVDCIDLLLVRDDEETPPSVDGIPNLSSLYPKVTKDELIIGALESSFFHMDSLIEQDLHRYSNAGGCTACVVLFINGKMYVANAGDSRAVLCQRKSVQQTNGENATDNKDTLNAYAVPFSFDHTPETDRERLMQVASGEPYQWYQYYVPNQYIRRPLEKDLGKLILCRQGVMKGWTYKTITRDDIKMPIVSGEGKRSRVLGTLGVTRGFGDHKLLARITHCPIKPFLTPHPDVNYRDLMKIVSIPGENNEDGDYGVLVIATDGLWDVSENETVANTVFKTLIKYPTEKHRYTMAAQELVAKARGSVQGRAHWRLSDGKAATVDDISVLVIPVYQYYKEHMEWEKKCAEDLKERLKMASTVVKNEANEDPPTSLANGVESEANVELNNEDDEEIVVEVNKHMERAVVQLESNEEENIHGQVKGKGKKKKKEKKNQTACNVNSETSATPLLETMTAAMAEASISLVDAKEISNDNSSDA